MSTLTVGLPPGVDESTGEQIQVLPNPALAQNDRQIWVVPSGEAWYINSVFAGCDTGAVAGSRVWLLDIIPQGTGSVAAIGGPAAFGPSISCFIQWGVGLSESSAQDSNSNIWQKSSLADIVITAGYEMIVWLRGSFGGDAFPGAFTGGPYALVTRYEWGSSAGGGGGTVAEATGPFIFVPGPEAA